MISTVIKLVSALVAFGILLTGLIATPIAGASPAPPTAAVSSLDGPLRVSSTLDVGACTSLYGAISNGLVHATGNLFSDLTCSSTFPNGLRSPVGVALYYPTDRSTKNLPVVLWTGGILSEPGNYDRLSKMLSSNGYVVAVPYDFINSFGYLPLVAANAVARANADPRSPLYHRVDVSRVSVAGHSAGGQAAQQATSLAASVWRSVIPGITIRSALAVEPGPVALGSLITVPTLYLSGYNDFVVPHYLWVRWTQYEFAQQVPAYLLCARGTGHLQPVDDPDHDPLAPIMLRWLDFTLKGTKPASEWFVGPQWKFGHDANLAYALRNRAAGVHGRR